MVNIKSTIDSVRMDETLEDSRLTEIVNGVRKVTRRRGVTEVRTTLLLNESIMMRCVIRDKGSVFRVDNMPGSRSYAFTRDGVERAFGDLIRVVHDSAEDALTTYSELLQGS